jgi:hypothetical protein
LGEILDHTTRKLLAAGVAATLMAAAAAWAQTDDAAENAWLASKPSGPQGLTIDQIKQLPDWSGAWALDNVSFGKTREASGSTTPNNPNVPDFTPKWAAYRLANGAANGGQGPAGGVPNNAAKCIPDGMPGIMTTPLDFEYLFTPGRVTIIASNGEVRRVYTDGRGHPDADDADWKFEGNSIGHWEGNTLVVDTTDILAKSEVFMGMPETGGAHVFERITKISPSKLQDQFIVTDPAEFVKPWIYTRTYDHQDNVTDDICQENNRDSNGVVDLTPPP